MFQKVQNTSLRLKVTFTGRFHMTGAILLKKYLKGKTQVKKNSNVMV